MPEFGKLSLVTDVTVPTLTVVRPSPAQANGTAAIVCPGGGFKFLNWESEGMEVARWLANRGVTAFVLKYRVRLTDDGGAAEKKDQKTFEDSLEAAEPKVSIARADAVQAIRHLRANADAYGIARDRIVLMGFSAGAMTTMSTVLKADADGRPDFAATIYGAMEDAPVPKDAPPLFIVHTQADALVPAAQATKMFNALDRRGATGRAAPLPGGRPRLRHATAGVAGGPLDGRLRGVAPRRSPARPPDRAETDGADGRDEGRRHVEVEVRAGGRPDPRARSDDHEGPGRPSRPSSSTATRRGSSRRSGTRTANSGSRSRPSTTARPPPPPTRASPTATR